MLRDYHGTACRPAIDESEARGEFGGGHRDSQDAGEDPSTAADPVPVQHQAGQPGRQPQVVPNPRSSRLTSNRNRISRRRRVLARIFRHGPARLPRTRNRALCPVKSHTNKRCHGETSPDIGHVSETDTRGLGHLHPPRQSVALSLQPGHRYSRHMILVLGTGPRSPVALGPPPRLEKLAATDSPVGRTPVTSSPRSKFHQDSR